MEVREQLSTDVLLNLEKSQKFEDLKTGTNGGESKNENEDEKWITQVAKTGRHWYGGNDIERLWEKL